MNLDLIADHVIKKVKSYNAHGDVLIDRERMLSIGTRMSKFEKLNRSDNCSMSLRLLLNGKTLVTFTTDLSMSSLDSFVERSVEMAKIAEKNKYIRLPCDAELYRCRGNDLQIADDYEVSEEELFNISKECEDSALSMNCICTSEGARASFSRKEIYMQNSQGGVGASEKTMYYFDVSPVAKDEHGNMEIDYDFSISTHFMKLQDPKDVGQNAANKSIKKLSGRKVKSCIADVIFDNRVSKVLLNYLLTAINGNLVAKSATFLSNKLNTNIFAKNVNIVDDPLMIGCIGSANFDYELVKCNAIDIVKDGILSSFLLNIESAEKLNMKTNGRCGGRGSIKPYNAYVKNGNVSFGELVKSIKNGCLITEVMGFGIDMVSGNYSQGACGFWIENGEIAYPVKEITVAGNMFDMFRRCIFANDLKIKTGCDSPSVYIEKMSIAGT